MSATDLEQWERAALPFEWKDETGRKAWSPFAEYDFLGRKVPRRLAIPDYLLMVARIEPGRVRRLPATAIPEEGDDENGSYSFVECPCGARPMARSTLAKCPGCERYYVQVGLGAVFVTYGAMAPPPLPCASVEHPPAVGE